MLFNNALEMIGNTPIVNLRRFCEFYSLNCSIFGKIEMNNPGGSVKDRIGLAMIENAEKNNKLKKGGKVVEPTSGNTGIGLAVACAIKGYQLTLVMPESMSIERQKLLRAYGAEIVLTPADKGMNGAVEIAEQIASTDSTVYIPCQFSNPINPLTHYSTTGPEIWEDLNHCLDAFVAGVGTGGTLCGTGKFLKEQDNTINVVGVEPCNSPMLSEGWSGAHNLQGIGANFIPDNFDRNVVDQIVPVSESEAYSCARQLARTEGLFVGISSGAALAACITLAKEKNYKRIAVVLPDTGERYLSTDLVSN